MAWNQGDIVKKTYKIEKTLGEGAFGIAYKARNIHIGKYVVLKTLNEQSRSKRDYIKYSEKFKKEGQRLNKVHQNKNTPINPHIVGIIDFFTEGDLPCLVMDYVEGKNLYDLIQEKGRLSEGRAVKYIRQIGSALMDCHEVGIIHRDAHPSNIMLRKDGNAVLIDFGISKVVGNKTQSFNEDGNPAFAPWEQIIIESNDQDDDEEIGATGEGNQVESEVRERNKWLAPTIDIYTLAASLYYLVTGKPPCASRARKYLGQKLKAPKKYNPKLSKLVDEAIQSGMALEPEDRPQSMEEWLKLLPKEGEIPPEIVDFLEKLKRSIGNFKCEVEPQDGEAVSFMGNFQVIGVEPNSWNIFQSWFQEEGCEINEIRKSIENILKINFETFGSQSFINKTLQKLVFDAVIWINKSLVDKYGLEIKISNFTIALAKRELTVPPTMWRKNPLSTEIGMDYRRLRDLLAAGKWREANEETRRVILAATKREEKGWLNYKSIKKFPRTDLQTIDQLWVKYSSGRFGLSVQKAIYEDLGGINKYNRRIWKKLGDRIGWRRKGKWINYKDVVFKRTAPKGHLPTWPYIFNQERDHLLSNSHFLFIRLFSILIMIKLYYLYIFFDFISGFELVSSELFLLWGVITFCNDFSNETKDIELVDLVTWSGALVSCLFRKL